VQHQTPDPELVYGALAHRTQWTW